MKRRLAQGDVVLFEGERVRIRSPRMSIRGDAFHIIEDLSGAWRTLDPACSGTLRVPAERLTRCR